VLADRTVVIVGLGRSGIAAARLCLDQGARVIGTDLRPREALSPELGYLPLELVAGSHDGVDFTRADLVVVSPGVPPNPALMAAERAGIEVIGELELASRFTQSPMVCIGGTNGKSTTTVLVGEMLAAEGQRVFVGGNLGTPLAEVVRERFDTLVLEVSSFQLERAPSLHPRVSVLLNITDDHLDRYPSLSEYARAKGNAFVHQTPQDFAVVPAGDVLCRAQAERGQARLLSFGERGDYQLVGGAVVERSTGLAFSLEHANLEGTHNRKNAAAAIAVVRSLGLGPEAVRAGLAGFRALPHRMARVGTVGRVTFYDDSKATNVGAAVVALTGLVEERSVLIAGGKDKLGSYAPLVRALRAKGRALVLIGEASERIAAAAAGAVPIESALSLEEAVLSAYRLAEPGDAVLLAPACSSFDMFSSYAERGDRFVAAVAELERRVAEEVPA
jgi:UDP-N-acetylmuramoylalanine--D-glutamate ligase